MSKFVLYEIPSSSRLSISSPCYTVKCILNLKGLPFEVKWTEYPDIKPLYEKNGVAPASWNPDGSPRYTLPLLYDKTSNRYISESFEIAKYLETTCGDQVPSVFPSNTASLHAAFNDACRAGVAPNIQIFFTVIWKSLNPESVDFYDKARQKATGKPLAEIAPTPEIEAQHWAKYKEFYGKMEGWYAQGNATGTEGPFLMGDIPSWSDFLVGGHLAVLRAGWGEDSEKWKDLRTWHSGRWAKLSDALRKYEGDGL
ncbi:hypothetical protein D9613_006286 [Agrocybe pediades]|uniref:GST N-terminal domain-containing protein n=1 Tax=Agrocybe pediades TaxID=84607 RepID=A0A8H4VRB6_9AGAR|nr:hypothetical protein D9613_006286 [Agrocybe pediades]